MKFYCDGTLKMWNKVEATDKRTGEPFVFYEYGIQTSDGSAYINSLKDFSKYIDCEIKMFFELKEFQDVQRLVLVNVEEL